MGLSTRMKFIQERAAKFIVELGLNRLIILGITVLLMSALIYERFS